MIKNTMIALTCVATLTTAAAAGNTDPVQTEAEIFIPADLEPTGSLASSSAGAAVPVGIGLLIIAALASGGGS